MIQYSSKFPCGQSGRIPGEKNGYLYPYYPQVINKALSLPFILPYSFLWYNENHQHKACYKV